MKLSWLPGMVSAATWNGSGRTAKRQTHQVSCQRSYNTDGSLQGDHILQDYKTSCPNHPKSLTLRAFLCRSVFHFLYTPMSPWKNCIITLNLSSSSIVSNLLNYLLYYRWYIRIGRVKVKSVWIGWISLYTLNLWVKRKDPKLNILLPLTQKLGCSDGWGEFISISTLSNHSIYYNGERLEGAAMLNGQKIKVHQFLWNLGTF